MGKADRWDSRGGQLGMTNGCTGKGNGNGGRKAADEWLVEAEEVLKGECMGCGFHSSLTCQPNPSSSIRRVIYGARGDAATAKVAVIR